MDSNVSDTLGADDCDVVDVSMSEVPIDSPDVSASFPPPDQIVHSSSIRSASDAPRKNRRYLWLALAGAALVAIIIGLSVGLTNNTNSGASQGDSSSVAEPRKATLDAGIEYFVNSNVSSAGDLRNPASSQAKAIAWLTEVDGRNLPVPGHPISTPVGYHYLSRYVLALLFFALDGENWTLSPYWLSPDDFCSWNVLIRGQTASGDEVTVPLGSYCDKISKKLVAIYLNANQLRGTLPKELAHLTSVQVFTISGNAVKGAFPREVCSWKELAVLIVSRNEFIGALPKCLETLSSMEVFVISKNEITGEIFNMSGLQEMRWLALDNNTKLTGDVTEALNSMTKLELLYLDDTKFSGSLGREFLRGSVNISEIDLSRCSFRGSIPAHLLELPELEVLDLQGNSLHGGFPAVTKWSSSLQYLSLASTGLNGTTPALGLSNLKHLDLSRNQLTTFPDLQILTNLERLFLAENPFGRGPIPSLENLTALRELSLKSTSRSGSISSSLGGLSDLILLDLDANNLNGTLPSELGELLNLEFVLINRNEELTGELPGTFSQLSNLRLALLDGTALNGSVDVLCGLPAFDNKSESADRTGIISADCGDGNGTAEVTCSCCQRCCSDSNPSDCQDFDEVPTLGLEWQYGYQRESFDFGGSAYFRPELNTP